MTQPEGGVREINGKVYWCQPKSTSGIQDPTRKSCTDENGIEYWCIPYDEAFPGRKYDGKGAILP